jgi:hypothetical protein
MACLDVVVLTINDNVDKTCHWVWADDFAVDIHNLSMSPLLSL